MGLASKWLVRTTLNGAFLEPLESLPPTFALPTLRSLTTMADGATLLSNTSTWLNLPSFKSLNTEPVSSPSPFEGKHLPSYHSFSKALLRKNNLIISLITINSSFLFILILMFYSIHPSIYMKLKFWYRYMILLNKKS